MPRVDGLREDILHALLRELAFASVQEVGKALQETLYFRLGLKTTRCVGVDLDEGYLIEVVVTAKTL